MPHAKPLLSRRDLLALMGAGATMSLAACSTLTYLLLRRRSAMTSTDMPMSLPPEEPAPEIVSRETWGALPPNHDARTERGFYSALNSGGWRVYDQPLHEVYHTVVVHHSVIIGADDGASLLEIQDLHRGDRGWADVAYHYFIGTTGIRYAGRDLNVRGAHVAGHNTGCVGICLLGDFSTEAPSDAQLQSAQTLIAWLTRTLQLTHIANHRDFNAGTQCPGDGLAPYLDEFARLNQLIAGTGGYVAPDA